VVLLNGTPIRPVLDRPWEAAPRSPTASLRGFDVGSHAATRRRVRSLQQRGWPAKM